MHYPLSPSKTELYLYKNENKKCEAIPIKCKQMKENQLKFLPCFVFQWLKKQQYSWTFEQLLLDSNKYTMTMAQ